MACTLNASYIQESDPFILEKLKACKDISDSQVAAMETLLLSGTTQYGYDNTFRSCERSSEMLNITARDNQASSVDIYRENDHTTASMQLLPTFTSSSSRLLLVVVVVLLKAVVKVVASLFLFGQLYFRPS